MAQRTEVPPDMLARIAAICLALPAAYEERAWTGMRWMVGKKNFAHAVRIENGWPPAYAEAAKTRGPATVLTFRSPLSRADAPELAQPPFFEPVWFEDIHGVVLDARTDWKRIAALLAASHAAVAPKRLRDEMGLAPADAGAPVKPAAKARARSRRP